ncbi:MAG: hypothetical protein FJY34_12565 [Betaproteobacteria bacterium]|nr:hypothetical protein [Betaproteobacteria bacterium]
MSVGSELSDRIRNLKTASLEQLDYRIQTIDRDLKGKQEQRGNAHFLTALSAKGQIDKLKLDFDIKLLQQEHGYVEQLRASLVGRNDLETSRQKHERAYRELKENEILLVQFKQAHPTVIKVPFTKERQELKKLEVKNKNLYDSNHQAYKEYEEKKKRLAALNQFIQQFEIQSDQLDSVLRELESVIAKHRDELGRNWVSWLSGPVQEVILTAFLVLLGIVISPVAIKILFYFVLAPLASRLPPICLLPNTSGYIEGLGVDGQHGGGSTKISAVSQEVRVDANHELIIHSEYLQSSSVSGRKETKWLLSNAYPMSSLASGMVALTRIRTEQIESVTVSATKDPLSEIGVLAIPKGSAIVLQPRNLVGVLQPVESSLRMIRLWRFSSLHAWLTLQLGYFVFHGPVVLIVKGCRGIRVEPSGTGRRVNQAATIGFSANAKYSTYRCDTFASYLFGKQELLNDSFAGDVGFYIYEEMPNRDRRTGVAGRGLEGFTDSVLKIFGI